MSISLITHLLRWSKATFPIEKGGLGIHKLADTKFLLFMEMVMEISF